MRAPVINLAQALLDRGRVFWEQDRYEEACRVLSRLLSLRALPRDVSERAQFYLGDMQLAMGHYGKARRHLAAAIGCGTGSGETHFLMACALEWDDEADARAAYRHYRKAVELDPGQPLYSSAYAVMRIRRRPDRAKYDREAIRRLRHAFAASPDDPDVVYNYAFGLLEMDCNGEAELVLRRARKRWPDHPAFENLWFEYLTNRGRLPQSSTVDTRTRRLRVVADDLPMILKFPTVRATRTVTAPLRLRSPLKTALASLDDAQLGTISNRLGLPAQGKLQQRTLIHRALRDPAQLQRIIARLSADGRKLLHAMARAGRGVALKNLQLRLDPPSGVPGPHWAARKPSLPPFDELRSCGLAYLTTFPRAQTSREIAMIPSDLRKVLRKVLADA